MQNITSNNKQIASHMAAPPSDILSDFGGLAIPYQPLHSANQAPAFEMEIIELIMRDISGQMSDMILVCHNKTPMKPLIDSFLERKGLTRNLC